MVAKIGKGKNLQGALLYNQNKEERGKGELIKVNKIPIRLDNMYSTRYLLNCFAPYLIANRRTEKPVRHISLNPDPQDQLSDARLAAIAEEYMQEMGYGKQPYVVYRHSDTARVHIHIVTTCVQLDGKKIEDRYDHKTSMDICRKLEIRHGLKQAKQKTNGAGEMKFKPVDVAVGDLKSQISAAVRYLPRYYKFSNHGTYNALLSLFNITSEEVTGESFGQPKKGMVYFVIDVGGARISPPFKSSLFGRQAGFDHLHGLYSRNGQEMKQSAMKKDVVGAVETAKAVSRSEKEFKAVLVDKGINAVVRRNSQGRIFGITFVDHNQGAVYNGSQLGKDLSANCFNELWTEQVRGTSPAMTDRIPIGSKEAIEETDQVHALFDFCAQRATGPELPLFMGLFDALGSGCDNPDAEEARFAETMRKKRKRDSRS